jgi:hypothetical protein
MYFYSYAYVFLLLCLRIQQISLQITTFSTSLHKKQRA